ncbi:MAG: DUF4864 domain-containing protein [Rhizobiales bacterium]|nr:DUF4864 domain-containing protein [Hyphomicrobiales bacterium]
MTDWIGTTRRTGPRRGGHDLGASSRAGWRRAIVAVLALVLVSVMVPATAGRAVADDGAPGVAIQSVIADQIAAFGADDQARAFAHASPMIQRRFGNAATFMDMVKRGYRPVYRPRDYRFVSLRQEGDTLVQDVLLTGPDGALTLARYELVLIDGVWRINGCTLIEQGEGV